MTLTKSDKDFIGNLLSVEKLSEATKVVLGELIEEKGLATKKDVENIVIDAINTVVISGMDNMAENIKSDIGMKIDSLDRKFASQQNRLDKHNDRIEKLEKIHPQGRHLAVI
jgi:hypothetical protein